MSFAFLLTDLEEDMHALISVDKKGKLLHFYMIIVSYFYIIHYVCSLHET